MPSIPSISQIRLINLIPSILGHLFYYVIALNLWFVQGSSAVLNFMIDIYCFQMLIFIIFQKIVLKEHTVLFLDRSKGIVQKALLLLVGGFLLTITFDFIIPIAPLRGTKWLFYFFWLVTASIGLILISVTRLVESFYALNLSSYIREAEKTREEFALLKHQLHPHLLFNTLNNLYGLVYLKDARAPLVVSSLSKFLRYNLYECSAMRVPLLKEKEMIEDYLKLQTLKSNDLGKQIDFYSDGVKNEHMIMPKLLLNFLEECFHIGNLRSEKGAWMKVNLEVSEKTLYFDIKNTVSQAPSDQKPEKDRIDGVRKMLEAEYPENHLLRTETKDNIHNIHFELNLI